MDAAFINEGNYVVAWPQSTWRRFSFSRGDFSCSRGHNVPGGVLGFPCLPCPHPDHRQKQTTSASTTLTFHPHQNPQKWVFLEHWLEREEAGSGRLAAHKDRTRSEPTGAMGLQQRCGTCWVTASSCPKLTPAHSLEGPSSLSQDTPVLGRQERQGHLAVDLPRGTWAVVGGRRSSEQPTQSKFTSL